jgi:hypothetical protein|nr:MAG TPA: hypothetical protein [Caudoviricetes sp.]
MEYLRVWNYLGNMNNFSHFNPLFLSQRKLAPLLPVAFFVDVVKKTVGFGAKPLTAFLRCIDFEKEVIFRQRKPQSKTTEVIKCVSDMFLY